MAAAIIASPAQSQTLVTYFNFNDQNETADPPGVLLPPPTITQQNLNPSFVQGTTINLAPGDLTGAGSALRLTFQNNGGGNAKSFQFTVSTVGLSNLSLSYATQTLNTSLVQTLSYSTDGTNFTNVGSFTPTTQFTTASFNLPTAVDNLTSVTFRITISGPAQNRLEYNDFDNIQLTASAVPEPGTIGAGLFGAIGLCWQQRRRLRRIGERFRSKARAPA